MKAGKLSVQIDSLKAETKPIWTKKEWAYGQSDANSGK